MKLSEKNALQYVTEMIALMSFGWFLDSSLSFKLRISEEKIRQIKQIANKGGFLRGNTITELGNEYLKALRPDEQEKVWNKFYENYRRVI